MGKKLMSKPVLCVELNKKYFNSREAEKDLKIVANNIRECCRGIRKTAGGYHWEEIEDIKQFVPNGFIQIKNIPHLFINKKGAIYSIHYNKIIKQQITDRGYYIIRTRINNQKKTLRVHRLVASTFIPNPNNYKEINHKDENKLNNCVENLEWCDRKYNMNYGTVKERISKSIKSNKTNVLLMFKRV